MVGFLSGVACEDASSGRRVGIHVAAKSWPEFGPLQFNLVKKRNREHAVTGHSCPWKYWIDNPEEGIRPEQQTLHNLCDLQGKCPGWFI